MASLKNYNAIFIKTSRETKAGGTSKQAFCNQLMHNYFEITFLSEVSTTALNTLVSSFKYIKSKTRGQMAFATILQVIHVLTFTSN